MSMTKEILQEKIKGQYDVVKLQGWLTALPNKMVSNTAKMSFVKKMKLKLDTAEVDAWVNELPNTPLTAVAPGAPKPTIKPVVVSQPTEELIIGGPKKKKVPTRFKKGDVLMHPIFRHPYVLLEKKAGSWVCGLLTSEPKCPNILEKTESRFFVEEYFTRVMFIETATPPGTYMYPFENPKQLKSVLLQLKQIFA
jgi:hypothetical protein